LMVGLVVATSGFMLVGYVQAIHYPPEAWFLPLGSLVFTISIAIDTIGHRTIYKQEISGAEGLVHGICIFCGIASCILLSAAYHYPHGLWIPALVLTVLAFIYSLIDEAFHWRRYVRKNSDRVEMWSHLGILTGHASMMVGWWCWFSSGYVGVRDTLAAIGA